MQLQKNIDYVIIKRACYFDESRVNQQWGNLIVTKNKVMFNVVQSMNVLETAFGEDKHKSEYKDDNLINSIHNIKVSTQEVKDSFKESKDFYRQRRETVKCYDILNKLASEAKDLKDFEMKVSLLSQGNHKSFEFNVNEIEEIKSGFFKIWFVGMIVSLSNGIKKEIQTPKVGLIKKIINK